MRNRYTAIVLLTLFLLTGLGLVLKRGQEPDFNPTSLPSPPETPVKDQIEAQRSLFQPLVPATTLHTNADVRRTDPNPAAEIEPEAAERIEAGSSATLASTLSARKLLQGNQHKQKATQFNKIGFNGEVLPESALRWSCARDTRTGLLWETKLFDAGISDVEHRYSWYDPARSIQGFQNAGSCYGVYCDTHAYAEEMNHLGLCGSGQWRLPLFAELETLLDRDYFNPVINQEIFFNTRGASYWTQSQLENNPEMVMQIDFFNGTSSPAPIYFKLAVRLVSE